MAEQLALLPKLLMGHINLALVALALSVIISAPLGVWISRNERFEGPVLGIAGVIQTIPSLALLAFMVPVLGFIGAQSSKYLGVEISAIGYGPALIALTLYSILPVLQNTITGIRGVDPALKEAALGVGMTERQRLVQVELPQAMPVMVAGIRTAAVWVVGMATLSTPIGAPSLGNYIFTGLQTRNYAAVTVGCVAAAGLALYLDNAIRAAQAAITRRSRGLLAVALVAIGGLYAAIGVDAIASRVGAPGADTVRLGAKGFTEQYICAELLGQQIQKKTGRKSELVSSLGSSVIFDALASGDIDVYVDFSGTVWTTIMKRVDNPKDPRTVLATVGDFVQKKHQVRMLGSLGFENTYAFGMRRAHMKQLGVRTLSDLVAHGSQLSMAGDYEFFGRGEWKSVQQVYGLDFGNKRTMDSALMYQALASEQVDVISAYSTDGRLDALDLDIVKDDKHAIPPYHAIILVRESFAKQNPQVVQALRGLIGQVDDVAMRAMNYAVDGKKKSPKDVARSFLEQKIWR